jgi:hypothetical protein
MHSNNHPEAASPPTPRLQFSLASVGAGKAPASHPQPRIDGIAS